MNLIEINQLKPHENKKNVGVKPINSACMS